MLSLERKGSMMPEAQVSHEAKSLTTGTVLRYLLALTPKWPIRNIYPALRALKKKHPQATLKLTFHEWAGNWHSRELERYLADFDTFGLVSVDNSAFTHYTIDEDAREQTVKEIEALAPEQNEQVKDLARDLLEELSQMA